MEPAIFATPRVLSSLRQVLAVVTGITGIYTDGSVPVNARTDYLVIGPFTERPDNTMGDAQRWGSELTTTIKLVSMNPDIGACNAILEQVIALLNAIPLSVEDYSAGMATLDLAVDSYVELVSGIKVWHYPLIWTVRVHQPV
jgi:hypothetical protein